MFFFYGITKIDSIEELLDKIKKQREREREKGINSIDLAIINFIWFINK